MLTMPTFVIKTGNKTIGGTRCHRVDDAKRMLAAVIREYPKARIVER